MMWKTFRDFVRLARRTYGLGSLGKAAMVVHESLTKYGLRPIDVVCYINWADGDCLSQIEIASKLKITQQAVCQRLQKIRTCWPHLFYFGPKVPQFSRKTSHEGITMGRLRADVSTTATHF